MKYTINKKKKVFDCLFYFTHKKIDRILSKIVNEYDKKGKQILEIGTGTRSRKDKFFKAKFITSDYVKRKNVDKIIDITNIQLPDKSIDFILCENVLEHVFKHQKAISEMYRILKPTGTIFIVVPFLFPLHDIPNDYHRYSEYSLKLLLSEFKTVEITAIPWLINKGLFKRLVLYYGIEARR